MDLPNRKQAARSKHQSSQNKKRGKGAHKRGGKGTYKGGNQTNATSKVSLADFITIPQEDDYGLSLERMASLNSKDPRTKDFLFLLSNASQTSRFHSDGDEWEKYEDGSVSVDYVERLSKCIKVLPLSIKLNMVSDEDKSFLRFLEESDDPFEESLTDHLLTKDVEAIALQMEDEEEESGGTSEELEEEEAEEETEGVEKEEEDELEDWLDSVL